MTGLISPPACRLAGAGQVTLILGLPHTRFGYNWVAGEVLPTHLASGAGLSRHGIIGAGVDMFGIGFFCQDSVFCYQVLMCGMDNGHAGLLLALTGHCLLLPGLAASAGHSGLLVPGHCLLLLGLAVWAERAGLLLPGHVLLLPGLAV